MGEDGDEATPTSVVLVGLMGSGKSTVGRIVARRLGWSHWDNDAELVRRSGRPLAELAALGTDELHRREHRVLVAGLTGRSQVVVAAPGSIVPVDDDVADLLRSACVVWLRATPATLASRVHSSRQARPLGGDARALLQAQAEARASSYAEIADLVVDVDDADPSDLADQILAGLAGR